MKTYIIATFCALFTAFSATAQTRFAKAIADEGAMIRKLPSATAPRALVNWAVVDNYHIPVNNYTYWSTATPKGEVQPDKFTGPATIVSENNGWYEIAGIGPKGVSGWVSAKECAALTPQPLTAEILNEQYGYTTTTHGGNTFVIYFESNEMDGDAVLRLGTLDDNKVTFIQAFYISAYENSATPRIQGSTLYYPLEDGVIMPELKQLDSAIVNEMIQRASEMSAPYVTVMLDGELHSYVP